MFCHTGTDNPDALAEQVTAAEDTKHRLFSFIGQLNGELEFMDAQISLLQQEVHSTIQAAAAKREQRSGIQKVKPDFATMCAASASPF